MIGLAKTHCVGKPVKPVPAFGGSGTIVVEIAVEQGVLEDRPVLDPEATVAWHILPGSAEGVGSA